MLFRSNTLSDFRQSLCSTNRAYRAFFDRGKRYAYIFAQGNALNSDCFSALRSAPTYVSNIGR